MVDQPICQRTKFGPLRSAVKDAIIIQVGVLFFLGALILDGGRLARVGGCAVAGFWVGFGIILLRRRLNLTSSDLLYIRLGFIPLFIVGIISDAQFPHLHQF